MLAGERCGAELAQRAANVVEFAQKPTPLALQSVVLGLERVALDDEGGELIISAVGIRLGHGNLCDPGKSEA